MKFGARNKDHRHFEPSLRRNARHGSAVGRFFYRLSLLAFCAAVIYVMFFSRYLEILKIDVQGTVKTDAQALITLIKQQISGKYLNLIPKNNLLLLSKDKIVNQIMEDFKLIEKLKIRKIFPNALEVTVQERTLAMVLKSNQNALEVDTQGLAFAEADLSANHLGEQEVIIFINEGDKEIEKNQKVLEADKVSYLLKMREQLKENLGLEIEKEIKTPQFISGDLRVKTIEGWMIFFDMNITLQKELNMLKVVLDEKVGGENRSNLEYVDLRTDNKVYYKLKKTEEAEENENEKTAADNSETTEKNTKKKKKD